MIDGQLEALGGAAKLASEHLAKVEAMAKKLDGELTALKANQTFTADFKLAEERRLRGEAQTAAADYLQRNTVFDSITKATALEQRFSRDGILRAAKFATTPEQDATEAIRWTVGVLPRAGLAELHGHAADAVSAGNLALANAVARETQFRASQPGAGDADRQTAREINTLLAGVSIPDADQASTLFGNLRTAKRNLENVFSALGRMGQTNAAVDRLHADRARNAA